MARKKLTFKIQQIALCPTIDKDRAMKLMGLLGWTEWHSDYVTAKGSVFGAEESMSRAELDFNYQAGPDASGLELETLYYREGRNWLFGARLLVSHLGTHCTGEELEQWRSRFKKARIAVAQELWTQNHTNPAIAGKRWYHYVIFSTREILGVDLKFIVRHNNKPA